MGCFVTTEKPSTTHAFAVTSPIGDLVVRATESDIVAIDWKAAPLGNKPRETPLLARARTALTDYFAGRLTAFDLPCAPAGTAFQRRVWAELCRIPYGETVTYGELARRVGSSARAVGNACGANPLPIVVPCHRVLAANGALGGYSGLGGTMTKTWLLEHESRQPGLFKRRLAS
jgi:methylated-DNA-[protein]-cysteine S-methyltransferase